nr:hypothetical protein [Tanacetum cinerariifolium]
MEDKNYCITQQLQDDYEVQATKIILHSLPPDVYAHFNHQEAAMDILDKVKLLMKALNYNIKNVNVDCNLFDKFSSVQGETLYEYYWRFSQLINDMHIIGMTMQQVQVNTKFLNALPLELSKFVTDVKLTKSLYTTNYDQLGIATTSKGNYVAGQAKVMKCYNCLGEGHMMKQCTQPKRLRNFAWFKEKFMFVKAQEAAFQTGDLDAYDSDCDDISLAKAILMADLSSCNSDVLSEVPYSDTYLNDMIYQDVQEILYSKQTHIMDFPDNELTTDSNIFPYSQYLQESQDAGIQDTNSSAPNDLSVLSLVEQMTDHVANLDKKNQTNKMVNESLTAELKRYKERVTNFEQRLNEIDTLKETLSNKVKEKESLSTTLTVFKTKSKEKESKYIHNEIVLENQNKEIENIICKLYRSRQAMHMLTKPQVFYDDTHKQAFGYQNPFHLKKFQRIKPTLYDGSVIAKEHDVIYVIDDEETLILEEESRSKMLDK